MAREVVSAMVRLASALRNATSEAGAQTSYGIDLKNGGLWLYPVYLPDSPARPKLVQ